MAELTQRQSEVLKFIQREVAKKGYPPTFREIAKEFEINSPNGVASHLMRLEKKGFIVREKNASRGITLTEQAKPKRGIPLINLSDITE